MNMRLFPQVAAVILSFIASCRSEFTKLLSFTTLVLFNAVLSLTTMLSTLLSTMLTTLLSTSSLLSLSSLSARSLLFKTNKNCCIFMEKIVLRIPERKPKEAESDKREDRVDKREVDKRPVQENTEKRPVQENTEKRPVHDNSDKRPVHDNSEKRPVHDNSEKRPVQDRAVESADNVKLQKSFKDQKPAKTDEKTPKVTLTLSKPYKLPQETINTLDRMILDSRSAVESLISAVYSKNLQDKIVINDARLLKADSCFLGHVVYTGAKSVVPTSNRASDLVLFLLPQFDESHLYATINVRISSEFLTYRGNVAVRKSALWGSHVYTDDSDIVAMIIHSGHYRPVDAPDSPQPADSLKSLIQNVPNVVSVIDPVIASASIAKKGSNVLLPDHDISVTLRVLPKLAKYTGSTHFGLDSRSWGSNHDGYSIKIERVDPLPRGSVQQMGRKNSSQRWGSLAKYVTKDHAAVWDPEKATVSLKRKLQDDSDITLVFSSIDCNVRFFILKQHQIQPQINDRMASLPVL
jgi:hypothetical protein